MLRRHCLRKESNKILRSTGFAWPPRPGKTLWCYRTAGLVLFNETIRVHFLNFTRLLYHPRMSYSIRRHQKSSEHTSPTNNTIGSHLRRGRTEASQLFLNFTSRHVSPPLPQLHGNAIPRDRHGFGKTEKFSHIRFPSSSAGPPCFACFVPLFSTPTASLASAVLN